MPNFSDEKMPINFSVEPLIEDDIEQLVPILQEHVRDRTSGEIVQEEIEAIKGYMRGSLDHEERKRNYFVAKTENGEVLGCMAYSSPDKDMIKHFSLESEEALEILNAFVASKFYRGSGIGKSLFNKICDEAKAKGKRIIVVHSGPRYQASWGFYDRVFDESCGFLIEKYGRGGDAKTWRKIL